MRNQLAKMSVPMEEECLEKDRHSLLEELLSNSIDLLNDKSSEELSKTIITLIYKKNTNPNLFIIDTNLYSNIYNDGESKYIELNTEVYQKDLPCVQNEFIIHTDYIFMRNNQKRYLIYKKIGIFDEVYNKLKEDDTKNAKELVRNVNNLLKTTFHLNREINLNNFLKEE